ncbi:gp41 [Burkholderia phage phi644-2]|uniref:Gp41 n=1 Tax=Burkholderia phage phi644-2 TaxID=2881400 RepID=A4JX36_9CAUD|nr:gp41 [Burkholderia phage phi644-2]ABO60820.1 gp41 [Burkholderia phage phi644-2]
MSGEVVAIMALDGVLELGPCQGFTDVVFVICMDVKHRGPRWVVIARRAGAVG